MDPRTDGGTSSADALVVFGITGDLARKMTLPSLYRLDRRGLLDCPVIGVAARPWTDEELRQHARDAITASDAPWDDAVFERFAARLTYVGGDFSQAATYAAVKTALGSAATPVLSTTNAATICPRSESAAPTTAHSATSGCDNSAASTSGPAML